MSTSQSDLSIDFQILAQLSTDAYTSVNRQNGCYWNNIHL